MTLVREIRSSLRLIRKINVSFNEDRKETEMFTNLFKKTETNLDKVIAKVTLELAEADPESKDYAILSETLVRLSNVKAQLEPDRRPRTEVLIQMAGILISLVSILNYERTDVITTKGMPLFTKLFSIKF